MIQPSRRSPDPFLRAADLIDPRPTAAAEAWKKIARPNQLPPPGSWFIWGLMAGRGFGKTRSGAEWFDSEARLMRPGEQLLLAGRTPADVRDYALNGPGGLLTHHKDIVYQPSKRLLVWPNGAQALIRSGANPEEFRGFSGSKAWLDEFSAWDYPAACWDNLIFGMREGDPQICMTLTPRPIPKLKELLGLPGAVWTRGSSWENRANLSERWVENVLEPLRGTRLGRQEIEAELLEDREGALWSLKLIEATRLPAGSPLPTLVEIAVGVDPQGTKAVGHMTGIVVVGRAADDSLLVLADESMNGSPGEWGAKAVAAYEKWEADWIVAESNYGGEMVAGTIRGVRPNVPVKVVHASRGKRQRAEPIATRYEQGTVHHVGAFAALEDEMCDFVPGESESPNRMDALVWAATALTDGKRKPKSATWGGRGRSAGRWARR